MHTEFWWEILLNGDYLEKLEKNLEYTNKIDH
jgi:hypothetical protein